jgi:hypothetical protein
MRPIILLFLLLNLDGLLPQLVNCVTAPTPLQVPEGRCSFFETRSKFHIHGWRWHTMSLIRDLNRLSSLASSIVHVPRISSEMDDPAVGNALDDLNKAAAFVVDINMKGLHRIEAKTFFPWLKKIFCTKDGDSPFAQEVTTRTEECTHNQLVMRKKGKKLVRVVCRL